VRRDAGGELPDPVLVALVARIHGRLFEPVEWNHLDSHSRVFSRFRPFLLS
jgi:hypothetical protein